MNHRNVALQQTLNDTLLILERNIFFFTEWVPYFVSLQEDHILMFKSRERWEQGLKPDKVWLYAAKWRRTAGLSAHSTLLCVAIM